MVAWLVAGTGERGKTPLNPGVYKAVHSVPVPPRSYSSI
jgi:hypothetical protein